MTETVMAGKPKYADDGENKFPPHPKGPHMMLCVDVVPLGEKVQQHQGNPPKLVERAAIVFASGLRSPNGDLWEVAREFSLTTGRKSNLRPFLEIWRGEPYTEDYPDVPLHKLIGHPAYITISHQKSETTGYTYANITSIAPLPPNTQKPKVEGYQRLARWAKKREQYAQDVAAFKAAIGANDHKSDQPARGFDAPLPPEPIEDSLPF